MRGVRGTSPTVERPQNIYRQPEVHGRRHVTARFGKDWSRVVSESHNVPLGGQGVRLLHSVHLGVRSGAMVRVL